MNEFPILYGDGVHDDTEAIQARIDGAAHGLGLPDPEVCYLISKPLELPSDFSLTLPRYAEVRLADGSDCVMLKNKTVDDFAERTESQLFSYVNLYSPDARCRNIEVRGGIWNFNNLGQRPNPQWWECSDYSGNYWGFGMLFYGVDGLHLCDMTFKDPINFCVNMDRVNDFTVENIEFDFNYGNPTAVNMDGIHVDGNCHRGVIRNLKGACYDDMVALNADEGSDGPISDVEISGIFALDSHSAVRLLTVRNPLTNIHIHDVYGTYYQYCVGVTRHYPNKPSGGWYQGIVIDHIYASKAERLDVYMKKGSYEYPLIWIDRNSLVKDITIADVHRVEEQTPVSTVHVSAGTVVENMVLERIFSENHTGTPYAALSNLGIIRCLRAPDVLGDEITGEGAIETKSKKSALR